MFDVLRTLSCRSVAVAAILGIAACGTAGAQTPPAPAPATQAPISNVGQPEPPASQMAAARDLVNASGMTRSFAPMVPQLMDQIVPMLTRTRPELKDNLVAALKDLKPDFVKKGDGMVEIAAKIYASQMSEQELKAAAAFFNSPVGVKYVSVQPAMLDQLVVAMQSWTQELSTYMMTRLHDEMKKRGQDF